jgi:hypothetical protein
MFGGAKSLREPQEINSMKIQIWPRLCLFCVIAILAVAMPSVAQNIRTVLFVKVKMGQEDNWKSAVKDYVALFKKAGSKHSLTVWDSQTGPSQHAVVWYSSKWKEMDEQDPAMKGSEAEMARGIARLSSVTESLEYWIDEMQPDLVTWPNDIPPMIRFGRTRVIPGKMDEVKAIFHDQVFPAVQRSGASDFGVAVARFGTPSNEIHTYLGMKGWANLDGPLGAQEGMTVEEYKAFQAKLLPLIESTEYSIWKLDLELSYLDPIK